MHQVAHTDQNWRKLDEMCYRKLMDTELLKESWEKLTERGYTLSRPAPEVVNIITPTGYVDSDSIETTAQLRPLCAVISDLLVIFWWCSPLYRRG